ncbi:PAS domain S-box protein [Pelagibacterium limicola]|uniref:PAS domain S-box protein n=1 Tax=Pelagibacterium limicola TaxID=2791022 RepID=UPI0018AF644D|nr:PAS domain S-box protein [Pelagibacterium limicola]
MARISEVAVPVAPTEFEVLTRPDSGVLEAIPGAVYICDADGWVVRYNAEAEHLWGRKPTTGVSGDRFCGSYRLHRPDGTEMAHEDCPMAWAVRTGVSTRNAEVHIERPDGARIVAQVNIRALRGHNGQIEGAINCFQDITTQRELEGEVRRQRDDLDDFFENAAIPLHIVGRDGRIQRANKAELDLLGYAPDEYLGRHIAEFHADPPVIEDILARLGRGEKLERYPARLKAKDGSFRHVLITSSSRFENGKFINTRCFTTDVTQLREAELARRDSDARLAATYEAAPVGIIETDASGKLLRVNDALCKMLGRTREELLGMTFFDYTNAEDKAEEAALYGQQVEGEIDGYSLRKRAVRGDGRIVYVDVYSSTVPSPDGSFQYAVRVLQDVTEAKLAEDRLRESEKRMHDLLQALPAAVYTTDVEGRITFFNKAAAEMAGQEPDPGQKWCVTWRLYNTDGTYLPHDECPMAIALKEGRSVRGVEAIAERRDGTRVPFVPYPTPLRDAEGKMVGAINMLVDISERRKAEEYAERLAAIVEFSDDGIISKDVEGVIQTWNKGAERLFGYSVEEAVGKPIHMLVPSDRADEEPAILERIRRGEHIDHYETVRKRKDGTLIDVSLSISPLKDARGRVVGASKIARDVTERRKAEERRQLLVNELNHRVKNSLATVQSLAAQTFRGNDRDATFRRFEERLVALSRAHDALTRENWEGVGLRELVEKTVTPMSAHPWRVHIEGPRVRLRPKVALSLSLALHELCTNALKYGALSREEGTVSIAWQLVPTAPGKSSRIRLRWEESGGPKIKPPENKGFGSRLIEKALTHELGAKVELVFPPTGAVCTIETDIDQKETS